jgi:hypothetical protein
MTSHLANYPNQSASSEEMLDALQRDAFGYFLHESNRANGLVVAKTQPDAPASIAAVGFALGVYPVGVERSWMTRAEAAERTLAVLRFFWTSPQGTAPDATGYKGFYYHFLDMKTGRRVGRSAGPSRKLLQVHSAAFSTVIMEQLARVGAQRCSVGVRAVGRR